MWIAGELKIMDETWLKELNERNHAVEGEDSSKWDLATVSLSSSVLNKLSQEEQAKFQITEFKRATNEIEHWARVEEICDFFGVEEPDLAGDVYIRKFKNLTEEDERNWQDLRDINDDIPEGFGVKVFWEQGEKTNIESKDFCQKNFLQVEREQNMSKNKENFNVTQGMTLLLLKKLSLPANLVFLMILFITNPANKIGYED